MQRIERDEGKPERASMVALKRRMAVAEEINRDLLAFAHGHAGAVATIHEAVLALLTAADIAQLATIVTRDWPTLLSVDAAAFVWAADGHAVAADITGCHAVEPRLVARMVGMERAITVRTVDRGHPLFGAAAPDIRAEIGIRLEGARGIGLILLGRSEGAGDSAATGARLLRFLARATATMLERWQLGPL